MSDPQKRRKAVPEVIDNPVMFCVQVKHELEARIFELEERVKSLEGRVKTLAAMDKARGLSGIIIR